MSEDPEDTLTPAALRLVALARDSLGQMSEAQRLSGARALRARSSARQTWPRLRPVLLVAAALLVVFGVKVLRTRQAELSVRVDGAKLEAGGLLRSDANEASLHFSDGSEVALAPSGRLHVRSLAGRGAHITLDAGRAHVFVVHAPDTHWLFDAGPFEVDVIGTSFALAWQESERQLDIRLENGAVKVSGPMSDAPLSLRAGQWLTVRGADVLIRPLAPEVSLPLEAMPAASASAASAAPAQAEPALSAPVSDAVRADHSAAATRAQWRSALAHGNFQQVVSDALALGLDGVLTQSSADELSALGDAARYSRHSEVARPALMALRRRFPSAEQAYTAAFLLGRLAEAEQDPQGALTWFQTYLTERPGGTYASEALGRKMTLAQRVQGSAAARQLAEEYLKRFPHGTYADAARQLAP